MNGPPQELRIPVRLGSIQPEARGEGVGVGGPVRPHGMYRWALAVWDGAAGTAATAIHRKATCLGLNNQERGRANTRSTFFSAVHASIPPK